MNSLACDRISPSASARSFCAAVTRWPISVGTCGPAFKAVQFAGAGKGTQAGQPTWVEGLGVLQLVATKSVRASHEYHSADQLRSGNFGALMMGNCPIVGAVREAALGPASSSVTKGRFTRSAKNQPALMLVALPPPPELALLPSLPSFPSKLAGMSCLLQLCGQA